MNLPEFAPLVEQLREQIRGGGYTPQGLRAEFDRYTDYRPEMAGRPQYGADDLDRVLDGLLGIEERELPRPENEEMAPYQPAPARIVLDLVDHIGLQAGDVLYDLGSGLGRPALLAHLGSGVQARGVEVDETLCGLARATAADLNLAGVEFIHADAREVDYGEGTVFFLFTPFKGELFRQVFAQLKVRSTAGSIRIGTYGPCTLWAATRPWLHRIGRYPLNNFNLGLFETR